MRKFFGAGPAGWRFGGLAAVGLASLGLAAFRGPLLDNPVQLIAQKLNAYYSLTQPEKVYLSFDRPAYGTGETVWFSAFVVDALRHQRDTLSKVLHVELLSPERRVVVRRTLRVVNGLSAGDIELTDSLQAGTYLLRAYTSWMLNGNPNFVFQKRLQVWPASPDQTDQTSAPLSPGPRAGAAVKAAPRPDVQFFPEGGTFVAGLPAVVGFKAQLATGRSVEISGQLLDAQGKAVGAPFGSQHAGMGHLSLVPAAGQAYHARVKLPDGGTADYPLPATQAGGYALRVQDAGPDLVIEARYKGTAGAPAPGPVALVSEVRGFLVGLAPRPITPDGAPVTWKVAKNRYPNGIAHFTLFDAANVAQAERLAFVQNGPAGLRVTITPDRASYAPHQQVRLKVQAADAAGQPVATHLALSVAEAGAATLDPQSGSIVSNLLLTSDLAGYVENPDYYFQGQSAATAQALDNLLLTQGWRRFVWKEVLSDAPPTLVYASEKNLTLSGTITGMGSRPLPGSQLTFIQTKPAHNFLTTTTGATGRFSFSGFSGQDTSVVTLQARRGAGGGSNVTIRPDVGPSVVGPPLPLLPAPATTPGVADYLRRSRQQQVQERQLLPDGGISRNIQLGNVAVTAKKLQVPADDSRRLYPGVVANTIIDFANMPSAQSGIPIFSLLQGRVAGLAISGTPPNQTISIRNQPTSLFLLDGMRVDADAINTIQSNDVEAVEVFKGTEAAIFGANSGGGVIAVYTKRGNKNYHDKSTTPTPGLVTVKLPGFYQTREFYMPRYGAPVMNAPTSDPRRLTIFWNPEVATDASGTTDVYFFTADGSGNFQVTVEGLSLAGDPGRGTQQLYVAPK
ncbi:MAG: TonB-dependent receptor plug domain-containing protein [Janthinobacterium lividum]